MTECLFTLHQIQGYIASLYLVEYQDRTLLLDGGARYDAVRVEEYMIREMGRPPDELSLALVSHMHPDHAGGAPLLRRRFSTPIAAHYEIDRWYRGVSGAAQHLIDTLLGHYSARQQFGKFERAWYPRQLKPDYLLHEQECLPLFSDWIAYAAPGHTLYDMVFYQSQEQLLYVGDLIIKLGEKIVLPFPTLFPELMVETLQRVAELPVKKLLLAHGGVIEVDDVRSIFTSSLSQVGRYGHRSFKLIGPLCSLAPDVRHYKHERAQLR
ncbi:MAG: MBL fold metallo-hydrolase [Deltaproteobacteria bacterium]|nr:MBL fold metallo-hydrolase [Deltaproteobacteria bacterium]